MSKIVDAAGKEIGAKTLPEEVKVFIRANIKHAMMLEFIKNNLPDRIYHSYLRKTTPEQIEFLQLYKECRIDCRKLQESIRKDYNKIIISRRNLI